jgi:uncharacterized damage-inducible protein DinB
MEQAKSKNGVYPPYFYNYIKLVEDEDLNTVLNNQLAVLVPFLNLIPEEKHLYKYAEGKWTIKETVQHIIDAERVFAYRAMAFSRKEINALPSFDDKSYAANSNANSRKWKDLVEELTAVRKSTIYLFNSFTSEQLDTVGIASHNQINAKALGYIIAGHATHHINIIQERYLAK